MLRTTATHIAILMQDQEGTVRSVYETFESAMFKAEIYAQMFGYTNIRIGGSPALMNLGGYRGVGYEKLYTLRPILRVGSFRPKMNVVYVQMCPIAVLDPEIDPLPFLRSWIGPHVELQWDPDLEIMVVPSTSSDKDWTYIEECSTI